MKTLLLSLILSTSAWAQVSQVDIRNFNFTYEAPMGEGVAENFSYNLKNYTQSQKVKVEKLGEDFKVLLEGVENQEVTIKKAPSLLSDATNIDLNTFNLLFTDRLSLTVASGNFESPEKSVDLNNLNFSCNRDMSSTEVLDQVIQGCIQRLSFKAGGFSTSGEGIDQALFKAIDEGHDSNKAAVRIKNLNLKVTDGKFDLSADINAQISGSAKGNGSMSYDPASKIVTVKVSSIKFSILDVTSKIFDELKKQESDSFKVSKPYLYIKVK